MLYGVPPCQRVGRWSLVQSSPVDPGSEEIALVSLPPDTVNCEPLQPTISYANAGSSQRRIKVIELGMEVILALPTAYMTSRKRVPEIFEAMKVAQAPERFSTRFLEQLEFKAKGDRLVINVLKALGFLDETGKPVGRYYEFLDQTQSERVLAEGIREAYGDLFAVNVNAQDLSKNEIVGKMKTLSQGRYSHAVLGHMADTFLTLCKIGDFSDPLGRSPAAEIGDGDAAEGEEDDEPPPEEPKSPGGSGFPPSPGSRVDIGGLVYNIQIVLPETRDAGVYDALFRSLKEHLT